nr:hypothetical protein BaRGS_005942 [Batillaria attramentaria]
MGAYRHHGLIPWDVDVDVMMHISQQKKVRRVLGEIEHFRLESEDLSGSLGFLRYRRPKQLTFLCSEILMRVNIFFFDENSTHVVGMSADYRGQAWPREFVFPLSYARFEQWMLPVPACVQRMLDILYGDNATSTCASYYLRFGVDRCRMRMPMGIVDCSRLYSAYPFVFRQLDKDTGYVIESRKVGDRTLDAVWAAPVPTVCRK